VSNTDKHLEDGAAKAGEPAGGEAQEAAEARLVEQARAHDPDAWTEIYRRHAHQVYAYIYYRLGDQHTAEDLAADVFVKAIAGIKGYAYRGTPLLAWLYRIAHNVTADHRKSASRRTLAEGGDAQYVEERRDMLRENDDRADMLACIRELTDDQQQVVILRFYHAMSHAEIAQITGKPEGAVKALQTRALRSLRRLMTGDQQRESA
jgi:RNA polymerase sigma-70 factor (ECF subfamily)